MGLISWLKEKLGGKPVPLGGDGWKQEAEALFGDVCIREAALLATINIIAGAIGKCEFKTFEKGTEKRGREWYLWNVEPNRNQNSSGFLYKLLSRLYRDGEVLVISEGDALLVADSFTRTPYVLFDDIFTSVTVGDFTFSKSFSQQDVLYWRQGDGNTKKVMDALYSSYSQLIGYAMKAYQQSRGMKGILYIDAIPLAGTEERKQFDELIGKRMSEWLRSDRAALPLGKGQKFEELKQKTYSNESTRDIRSLVDDVGDFTSRAFGVPPSLLRGDVQDTSQAMMQLLTFCIDPLADMLQEEINRKRYGRESLLGGTYIKIDTRTIKHIDILGVAANIEKLISSGSYSVNDVRKLTGEQEINEPWADEHWITKNFERATDALASPEE